MRRTKPETSTNWQIGIFKTKDGRRLSVTVGGRNEETYSKYAAGIRKKVSELKTGTDNKELRVKGQGKTVF